MAQPADICFGFFRCDGIQPSELEPFLILSGFILVVLFATTFYIWAIEGAGYSA